MLAALQRQKDEQYRLEMMKAMKKGGKRAADRPARAQTPQHTDTNKSEKLLAWSEYIRKSNLQPENTSTPPASSPEFSVSPSSSASQMAPSPASSSSSQSPPANATPGKPPDPATILAVLGLIDDAGGTKVLGVNPQLELALRSLLAEANARNGDDGEVVPLDKENVKPDAFRRRLQDLEATKSVDSLPTPPSSQPPHNTQTPTNTDATPTATRPHGLGLGGRSNTLPAFLTSFTAATSHGEAHIPRSRKGKEKARESLYRSHSAGNPLDTQSSPSRSYYSNVQVSKAGTSRQTAIVIPDSPCTPKSKTRVAASSPIRGTNHQQGSKKGTYVVPQWARTGTATQPKFSEEYQRAMEEVEKKRQEEHKKGKRAQRAANSRSKSAASLPTRATTTTTMEPQVRPSTPPRPVSSQMLPPAVAASCSSSNPYLSLPVFASCSIPIIPAASFAVPQTPPRKRPRSPSQSPLYNGGALFTPTKTPGMNVHPSPLFSPSPSRRARKMHKSDPTPLPYDDDEADDEDGDILGQELDSALSELSSPEDGDADNNAAGEDADIGSDNDEESCPRQQYWQGLPPSSPPPSSPMQQDTTLPSPDTLLDESEDDTLPIATSDVEEDFLTTDEEDRTPTNSDAMQATSEAEPPPQTELSLDIPTDADLFCLFTNLDTQASDPLDFDWAMQSDSVDGNVDLCNIDFASLWADVKPLIDQQHQSMVLASNDDSNELELDFENMTQEDVQRFLDHAKLAEDLSGLYSGCVM